MSKCKVHEFDPQIYPRKLWIIKGGLPGDIKDMFILRDGKEIDFEVDDYDAVTYSVMLKEKKKYGELIWYPDEEKIDPDRITHESVHAAMDIFGDIGAEVDIENQDPFAYLAGWIADCIDQVKRDKFK